MPPKSKKSSSSKSKIPQEQMQQISIKESAILSTPSVSEQVLQIIYAVQAMNSKAFNQIWDYITINTARSIVVKSVISELYNFFTYSIYDAKDISRILKIVIDKIPELKTHFNDQGHTLLSKAVLKKQYTTVKVLVELGFDPNHKSSDSYTLLQYSGRLGYKLIYDYLKPLSLNKTFSLFEASIAPMTFDPPAYPQVDSSLVEIKILYYEAKFLGDVKAADLVLQKTKAYVQGRGKDTEICMELLNNLMYFYNFAPKVTDLVAIYDALMLSSMSLNVCLELLNEICRCYAVSHDYRKALQYAEIALDIINTLSSEVRRDLNITDYFGVLYYNLAMSYSIEEPRKALFYYSKVKEYIPEDDDLYLQEALLLLRIGDNDKALCCIDKIVDISQKKLLNIFFRIQECHDIEEFSALLDQYEYETLQATEVTKYIWYQ